jgi:hypothetical protein
VSVDQGPKSQALDSALVFVGRYMQRAEGEMWPRSYQKKCDRECVGIVYPTLCP